MFKHLFKSRKKQKEEPKSIAFQEPENEPPLDHWEALLRGNIIAATTNKLFGYVRLADQKAQVIIVLNSIIIPVAISILDKNIHMVGATISIITGIASILMAITCIYPKRRSGRKPDGSINHLHFSDISKLTEREYLTSFQPIYNDRALLTEEAVKDIHDVSRRILRPKFRALKLAYILFFSGNVLAILYTTVTLWAD